MLGRGGYKEDALYYQIYSDDLSRQAFTPSYPFPRLQQPPSCLTLGQD
jgi:hypothetical protein